MSSSLTNYIALNLQACIALHWHNIYEGYLCKICLIYSLRLLLYVMRCLLLQQTKKKAGHLQSREEEGAFCCSGMSSWAHHLLSGDIWFLDWSTHLSFIHLFLQLFFFNYKISSTIGGFILALRDLWFSIGDWLITSGIDIIKFSNQLRFICQAWAQSAGMDVWSLHGLSSEKTLSTHK